MTFPNGSVADTVNVAAAPAVTPDGPVMVRADVAAGVTVMTPDVPVRAFVVVSVAEIVRGPAVLRVAPWGGANVWVPLSNPAPVPVVNVYAAGLNVACGSVGVVPNDTVPAYPVATFP